MKVTGGCHCGSLTRPKSIRRLSGSALDRAGLWRSVLHTRRWMAQIECVMGVADDRTYLQQRSNRLRRVLRAGHAAVHSSTTTSSPTAGRPVGAGRGDGHRCRPAALAIVSPSGSVIGGDVSPNMLGMARKRLASLPVRLGQFDAHDLPFPEGSFDGVICQLGLMFFDDPLRALREFRRVLRPGGRAAVSVNSTPERPLFLRVGAAIAEHVPAGFQEVSVSTETREIGFVSFDGYFSGIEKGCHDRGQEYVRLPEELRHRVRADVRRGLSLPSDDVAFTINMELLIGCGRA